MSAIAIAKVTKTLQLSNWKNIACFVVLFLGSAAFAEETNSSKYPEYPRCRREVSRFFPGRKYSAWPAPGPI